MTNTKTLWLVESAMGIALILTVQYVTKLIPAMSVLGSLQLGQLITGTLVNAILVVMCIKVDWKSASIIGIVSAIMATLIGIGPIFPIITPFIAASNAILVIVFYFVYTKSENVIVAIIPAAIVKCAFLWISVPMILKVIPDIMPPQVMALTTMFSWPQGITALCGGLLAALIIPLLKGIHKN